MKKVSKLFAVILLVCMVAVPAISAAKKPTGKDVIYIPPPLWVTRCWEASGEIYCFKVLADVAPYPGPVKPKKK